LVGLNFSYDLTAYHLGVKIHRLVEILSARGEGSDSFDIEHGSLLEWIAYAAEVMARGSKLSSRALSPVDVASISDPLRRFTF
jgi:hypothetical protein